MGRWGGACGEVSRSSLRLGVSDPLISLARVAGRRLLRDRATGKEEGNGSRDGQGLVRVRLTNG